jgi:hypothetical protein
MGSMSIPDRNSENMLIMGAVNRFPAGYTSYICGRSDNVATARKTEGSPLTVTKANVQGNSHKVSFKSLDNFYMIGGRVIWEGSTLDDYIDVKLVAQASSGAVDEAGDFNKVEVVPSSGLYIYVPTTAGQGNVNINLAAKYTNTNILKMTPVPVAGNTGYFDYDSKENTLTVNATQTGGYNLYSFDITLFNFATQIWGRKGDGLESVFGESNIVGKLLYNTWRLDFELLGAVNTASKAGILLSLGVKKNTN